jgi:hypothetical protein
MTPETIDTIGPLWIIVIAIVVGVLLVCWATAREEKDDVQQYLDARRRHDLAGRDV